MDQRCLQQTGESEPGEPRLKTPLDPVSETGEFRLMRLVRLGLVTSGSVGSPAMELVSLAQ